MKKNPIFIKNRRPADTDTNRAPHGGARFRKGGRGRPVRADRQPKNWLKKSSNSS